jgi:tetratricopeptide (TPR) repeat protein
VLLTDFVNNTGEKRFDALTELVRNQLSQSAYFQLVSVARVGEVLVQMIKPQITPEEPSIAREVAMRVGASRVIFGVVSRVGDNYLLDIDVEKPDIDPHRVRAQWGNHWSWSAATQSDSSSETLPTGLLGAVRDSSDWIRREVGETANDLATLDAPPEDVTTNNWQALVEFAAAEKMNANAGREDSVIALQNAVKADPQFSLAHMRLGDILVSLGRYEEGYRHYEQALKSEGERRLTRREKDRLVGIFALDTGDFDRAEQAFHDYTVYYSNDYLGWFYRAYPLMMMGRVEEALTTLKKAEQIEPSNYSAPNHLARFNLILGRFGEAANWVNRLREIGRSDDADYIQAESEFLQGNYESSKSLLAKVGQTHDPLYRIWNYALQACLAAELGKYKEAIDYLNQGMSIDLEEGDTTDRADNLLARAYLNLKQGNLTASLSDCKEALKLDHSLQRSLTAGTLLSRAASASQGSLKKTILTALQKIQVDLDPGNYPPESSFVRARLSGEMLLVQGKPEQALREFLKADALDAVANDREYLARAFLAVADTSTGNVATAWREKALAIYEHIVETPGQIWQEPRNYSPGFWIDTMFDYSRLAINLKVPDGRDTLERYLHVRESSDPDLSDGKEARNLLKMPSERKESMAGR